MAICLSTFDSFSEACEAVPQTGHETSAGIRARFFRKPDPFLGQTSQHREWKETRHRHPLLCHLYKFVRLVSPVSPWSPIWATWEASHCIPSGVHRGLGSEIWWSRFIIDQPEGQGQPPLPPPTAVLKIRRSSREVASTPVRERLPALLRYQIHLVRIHSVVLP
ncbi:hypothetical protein GQ53DRAFT_92438 [Thozetella sp. PMI_491]|nr:hypothetical protein GQ53DRAFT_92438 [Thozetella sp. PMI_491]